LNYTERGAAVLVSKHDGVQQLASKINQQRQRQHHQLNKKLMDPSNKYFIKEEKKM